mgnify:CR=1 FL=1
MNLAKTWSQNSKDPSSKIGAVAVRDGNVLALGYNGFPKGLKDNDFRLNDRDTKYKLTVHAELNVVYNAAKNGVSLEGSTMFIYGLPMCSDCALAMIQAGVKHIVLDQESVVRRKDWVEKWDITKSILKEANIEWTIL